LSGWHLALLIAVFATDLVVFLRLCLDELRPEDRAARRRRGHPTPAPSPAAMRGLQIGADTGARPANAARRGLARRPTQPPSPEGDAAAHRAL
jgi:hypothetical protein